MNPLGLPLLSSTASPNVPALRRYRCHLQPSQRRRCDSILDRGFQLHGPPLAAPEGIIPPLSPRRNRGCKPLRFRESVRSALPLLLTVTLQAEALWMSASEPAPFRPPFDPRPRRTPRWDDIPAINFSPHGGNPISPASVTRAIEVRQVRFHRLRSDT